MLFNSLAFLVFIGAFLPLYFVSHGRSRLWLCLGASYLFYGWWDWRFLSLIAFSTLVDYAIGLQLARLDCGGQNAAPAAGRRRRPGTSRRMLLATSMAINLGILGCFKYCNFFSDSLADLLALFGLPADLPTLDIILPVGISFYTFQTMSYTIDVYRRRMAAEPSLLRFATFVALFPQLVAGPIVRASHLLPQLGHDQRPDWRRLVSGVNLILWGYVLKLVVADSLAPVVESRFRAPTNHSSLSLIVGVLFYAFQIYGDFCGYSSIAIGIGRLLGFDFGINFDRPYFARSFSDFWARWHISLSGWLRDYLYIPLGGSRRGGRRTLVNLLIVMFLGGLWHGADWTFVVWGLIHGGYLIGQRLLGPGYHAMRQRLRIPPGLSNAFLTATVFILTCFAWIFFRAESLTEALVVVRGIASFDGMDVFGVPDLFLVVKGMAVIVALATLEWLSFRVDFGRLAEGHPSLNMGYALACAYALALLGTYEGISFIYFQF